MGALERMTASGRRTLDTVLKEALSLGNCSPPEPEPSE